MTTTEKHLLYILLITAGERISKLIFQKEIQKSYKDLKTFRDKHKKEVYNAIQQSRLTPFFHHANLFSDMDLWDVDVYLKLIELTHSDSGIYMDDLKSIRDAARYLIMFPDEIYYMSRRFVVITPIINLVHNVEEDIKTETREIIRRCFKDVFELESSNGFKKLMGLAGEDEKELWSLLFEIGIYPEPTGWGEMLTQMSTSTAKVHAHLSNKTLPTNEELQRAYTLFKKGCIEKEVFDSMCDMICTSIKEKSSSIMRVWPSYIDYQPDHVVFVVMCCEPIELDSNYHIHIHTIGSFDNEAKDVMYHDIELNEQFFKNESESIASTIEKYAEKLMGKHSNICMISASPLKSYGYGTENAKVTAEPCIVLYVDIKGYIPIHEEVFPTSLNVPDSDKIIQIDVRESSYQNYQGAQDFHEKIKLGCMIRGLKFGGTSGGFIEKNNEMFVLTAAHTFLEDDSDFKRCLEENGVYTFEPGMQEVQVYQNKVKDEHKIGHIVYAAIDKGENNRSGVDIAVIHLTNPRRLPVSGHFPECDTEHAGFSIDEPMQFTSGLTFNQSTFSAQARISSEAYKFGSATNCTKGCFVVQGVAVRTMDCPIMEFGSTLFKQYEVHPLGDHPFAANGDSGALVFAKHNGKLSDLRVMGMVEGGTNHKTCIVTPIWDIFKKLDLRDARFKNFPVDSGCTTDQEVSICTSSSSNKNAWVRNDEQEQDLAQELSRHVNELKQEQRNIEQRFHARIETSERNTNEKLNEVIRNTNEVMNKLNLLLNR